MAAEGVMGGGSGSGSGSDGGGDLGRGAGQARPGLEGLQRAPCLGAGIRVALRCEHPLLLQ